MTRSEEDTKKIQHRETTIFGDAAVLSFLFFFFLAPPPLLLLIKSSLQEISALPFSREVLRFCGDRFKMWSYVFKIIIITIIIIIIIKKTAAISPPFL